jgi:hypothetical protein
LRNTKLVFAFAILFFIPDGTFLKKTFQGSDNICGHCSTAAQPLQFLDTPQLKSRLRNSSTLLGPKFCAHKPARNAWTDSSLICVRSASPSGVLLSVKTRTQIPASQLIRKHHWRIQSGTGGYGHRPGIMTLTLGSRSSRKRMCGKKVIYFDFATSQCG